MRGQLLWNHKIHLRISESQSSKGKTPATAGKMPVAGLLQELSVGCVISNGFKDWQRELFLEGSSERRNQGAAGTSAFGRQPLVLLGLGKDNNKLVCEDYNSRTERVDMKR
jgi:hypothetical protein